MTRVGAHNQFMYFPRESNCPVCSEAIVQNASCAANPLVEQDTLPPAVAFADRVAADHVILNDDDKARSADQVEIVIRDKFTKWSQACPAPNKSHQECVKAVQRFLPPFVKAERVYTDNAGELAKAVSELPLSHDKCTPHRPCANGVAERVVQKVKEGTSALMFQAGLSEDWWQAAIQCFCFPRNVVDELPDGSETAYERNFKVPFAGPVYPFGCEVSDMPTKLQKGRPKVGLSRPRAMNPMISLLAKVGPR